MQTPPAARPAVPGRAPRVTVITACYNDGATVGDTIASCLGEDCEVVLVDDGSTDPFTIAELERLAVGPVRLVRQENGGLSAARMRGLEEVRTPYVFPLDADDQLLPGSLARLADALDRDPGLAVVWGDYEIFGDYGRVRELAHRLDPWQITYLDEIPAASLVRRDALVAAGGWRSAVYEDWNLWLSFAERGLRGERLPIVAYRYRRHGVRKWEEDFKENRRFEGELRAAHPALYAARGVHWRRSRAPLLNRLAFPLIDRLPGLSEPRRVGLLSLVSTVAHRRTATLRWLLRRRAGSSVRVPVARVTAALGRRRS